MAVGLALFHERLRFENGNSATKETLAASSCPPPPRRSPLSPSQYHPARPAGSQTSRQPNGINCPRTLVNMPDNHFMSLELNRIPTLHTHTHTHAQATNTRTCVCCGVRCVQSPTRRKQALFEKHTTHTDAAPSPSLSTTAAAAPLQYKQR